MRYELSDLTITFEKEEIGLLWNIVMFALDWQNSELTKNESKMTDKELELARKLESLTNEYK